MKLTIVLLQLVAANSIYKLCDLQKEVISVGRQPTTIATPRYPDNFDVQTQCKWTLKSNRGGRIKIVFDEWAVPSSGQECRVMYIAVVDSGVEADVTVETKKKGVNFCGANPGTFVSASSQVELIIHSDSHPSGTIDQRMFLARVSETEESPTKYDIGRAYTSGHVDTRFNAPKINPAAIPAAAPVRPNQRAQGLGIGGGYNKGPTPFLRMPGMNPQLKMTANMLPVPQRPLSQSQSNYGFQRNAEILPPVVTEMPSPYAPAFTAPPRPLGAAKPMGGPARKPMAKKPPGGLARDLRMQGAPEKQNGQFDKNRAQRIRELMSSGKLQAGLAGLQQRATIGKKPQAPSLGGARGGVLPVGLPPGGIPNRPGLVPVYAPGHSYMQPQLKNGQPNALLHQQANTPVPPPLEITPAPPVPENKHTELVIMIGIATGVITLVSIIIILLFYFHKRVKKQERDEQEITQQKYMFDHTVLQRGSTLTGDRAKEPINKPRDFMDEADVEMVRTICRAPDTRRPTSNTGSCSSKDSGIDGVSKMESRLKSYTTSLKS